jgi:hypothetical protein
MALLLTQLLTEMRTRNIYWEVKVAGASTSWNLKGLSRPVMGLLYLYLFTPNI